MSSSSPPAASRAPGRKSKPSSKSSSWTTARRVIRSCVDKEQASVVKSIHRKSVKLGKQAVERAVKVQTFLHECNQLEEALTADFEALRARTSSDAAKTSKVRARKNKAGTCDAIEDTAVDTRTVLALLAKVGKFSAAQNAFIEEVRSAFVASNKDIAEFSRVVQELTDGAAGATKRARDEEDDADDGDDDIVECKRIKFQSRGSFAPSIFGGTER